MRTIILRSCIFPCILHEIQKLQRFEYPKAKHLEFTILVKKVIKMWVQYLKIKIFPSYVKLRRYEYAYDSTATSYSSYHFSVKTIFYRFGFMVWECIKPMQCLGIILHDIFKNHSLMKKIFHQEKTQYFIFMKYELLSEVILKISYQFKKCLWSPSPYTFWRLVGIVLWFGKAMSLTRFPSNLTHIWLELVLPCNCSWLLSCYLANILCDFLYLGDHSFCHNGLLILNI